MYVAPGVRGRGCCGTAVYVVPWDEGRGTPAACAIDVAYTGTGATGTGATGANGTLGTYDRREGEGEGARKIVGARGAGDGARERGTGEGARDGARVGTPETSLTRRDSRGVLVLDWG